MLPSDEKAHFGDIILTPDAKNLLIFQHQNCTEVAQHLYITSDEEINNDDWCVLDLGENTRIVQVESLNSGHPIFTVDIVDGYAHLSDLRKIIATTDKSITIYGYDSSDEESIVKCYFPHLSKEFIEAYIKAYNEGNIITDVAVEYENTVRNRFGEVHIQTINDGEEYIKTTILISSILKVNPDNTINIKQSKDSWSRNEVVELCTKAVIYGFEHSDEDNNGNYDDRDNNETLLDMFVENFIKENL